MITAPNNWIVTGGSGFLGTEICEQLSRQNIKVVNFDQSQPEYSYDWDYLCGTLSQPEVLVRGFKNKDFGIVHAAALKSVSDSINDPASFEKNNFSDSVTFYDFMQRIGCKHFIFISSAAVYGDKYFRVQETDNCDPISKYGKTKYDFEKYLMENNLRSDCKVTIIRPFNIVGVNAKGKLSGSVISKVASSKFFGSPFIFKYVHSPDANINQRVEPVRDYIDVKDVASLVRKVISGAKNGLEIINASTGNGSKLSSIIDIVERIGIQPLEIQYESMEREEIPYSVGNNEVANMCFGWFPQTSLSDSVKSEYEAIAKSEIL